MKTKSILSLALLANMMSCGDLSSANKDPHQAQNQDEETVGDGGMSSGGGGLVTSNPASQKTISQNISKIKRDLRLFFNYQTMVAQEHADFRAFFLEKSPDVFQVIDEVTIVDQTSGPCRFNNNDTDGSFVPDQGICLSSAYIAGKVDSTAAYSQTMGLAIHELAHAMGANESKAVALQKNAVEILKVVSQSPDSYYDQQSESLEAINMVLGVEFPSYYWFKSPKDVDSLLNKVVKLNPLAPQEPFAITSYEIAPAYLGLMVQYTHVAFSSTLINASDKADRRKRLTDLFEGADEVPCDKALGHEEDSGANKVVNAPTSCKLSMLVAPNESEWVNSALETTVDTMRDYWRNIYRSFHRLDK